MEYKKINEVKQYFIDKYGAPSVQKIGQYTYKTINAELSAFDKFIKSIIKCSEVVGLINIEKQINIFCEYAKQENAANLEILAKRIETLIKQFSNRVNFDRNNFKIMMIDIGKIVENKNFDPRTISNYFSKYLKIRSLTYNIRAEKSYAFMKRENLPYTR